jgi:hypothetical protein
MCMQSKKSAAAAPKKSMSADDKAEIAKFDAWVRLESGEREMGGAGGGRAWGGGGGEGERPRER